MFYPTHADEAMAIYLLPGFGGRPDKQVEWSEKMWIDHVNEENMYMHVCATLCMYEDLK